MKLELKKRIITSIILFTLIVLMFFYTFILFISLIIITIIAWIEFYALISKIFKKSNSKHVVLRFTLKSISLLYLFCLLSLILIIKSSYEELEIIIIYSILISIMTDIGGLIVGRYFKGIKLTKISPNKTLSGAVGSFVFSLFLIPFFIKYFLAYDFFTMLIVTLIISLSSQIGDLYISFLKRKAKVKDTSDLLPGHGGILDRIDGMILSIPVGLIMFNYF